MSARRACGPHEACVEEPFGGWGELTSTERAIPPTYVCCGVERVPLKKHASSPRGQGLADGAACRA